MAALTTRRSGAKFLTFRNEHGQLRTLSLGVIDGRTAQTIRSHVERLVSAKAGHALTREETLTWLKGIGDDLHAKLAALELVAPRASATVQAWLDKYLADLADQWKPKTRLAYRSTADKLIDKLGATRALRAVTPNDAAEWRITLIRAGLSAASVRSYCGWAKSLFQAAVDRGLIESNPLALLKSGATAAAVDRYITPAEADSIIAELPDIRFKVLFGLARLAGLRCPSEVFGVLWGDVDWTRGRLNVRSVKTERHGAEHARRQVPIDPKLMALLTEAWAQAEEGQTRVVPLQPGGYIRATVEAAAQRAGVPLWPRFFQVLRQSAEKAWAADFPQFVVSRWIGHSITVSGKHYANAVPDEVFARAAGLGDGAQRQAQRPMQESGGKCGKMDGADPIGECDNDSIGSYLRESADFGQIGATRFELATSASRTQRSKPG